MTQQDKFMLEAIEQAKYSIITNDVPVGCVIVFNNEIIARAYNRRVADKNTISHCEILAIKKACEYIGDWRLEGCTMYVTMEPCAMCAGALLQSRIDKVIIGTANHKFGCCGSVINLLDNDNFNHKVEVVFGVMQEECLGIVKDFFSKLRRDEKENNII